MLKMPCLAAGALILSLATGCGMAMHGMCGMHGMHGGPSHPSGPAATRVIEETRLGSMVLTLDVPALRVGQEETLTLAVVDASTAQPVSGLTVTFAVRRAGGGHVGGGAPTHGSGHTGDAGETTAATAATAVLPGTYAVRHTFGQAGPVEIWATVSRDGMASSTLRVTQDVHATSGGHGEGTRALAPLAALGGVVMMVAMMVLKVAWL